MTDHHAHGQPRWSESARLLWLAGVDAWTRGPAAAGRVTDGLVRDEPVAGHGGTVVDEATPPVPATP